MKGTFTPSAAAVRGTIATGNCATGTLANEQASGRAGE